MEDYEDETDSFSDQEELESELYSVLHYNSFSGELPPELLEKYNIRRENNEFFISLRKDNGCQIATSKQDSLAPQEDLLKIVDESSASMLTQSSSKSPVSFSEKHITSTPDNSAHPLPGSVLENRNTPKRHVSPIKQLSNSKASLKTQVSNVIVIEDEKSQDSDVIIQESVQEITYISSSSSVECLSDSDNLEGIMLNTSGQKPGNIFPDVEEIEEVVHIKWREVSSPGTWSESMKKYYNKPSKRLKYFDHEKILQEIKGTGAWHIIPADLFPPTKPKKRCTLCRQTDHLIKNCPKKFANCTMCGNPGHSATNCPFRMCLNCGKKNNVFIAMCQHCESSRNKTCDECKQVGHIRSNCPDTWRRFHSTTKGELNEGSSKTNEKLMCCNCGKEGHLYENCQNLYWSAYPPSSFLVKNKTSLHDHQGKRKFMNAFDTPREKKKKPRWSEPSFNNNRYYNNVPNTPQSNKKKKKRKNKSPRFKGNMKFNRNNTL